jgi:hypothetical protein
MDFLWNGRQRTKEVGRLLMELQLASAPGNDSSNSSEIISLLLAEFRRYPKLAQRDYPQTCRQRKRVVPMCHFLWSKASSDAIQALCEMTPNLEKHMRDHELLHMACQESSPDVIEVLARQVPNLLAQKNRREQVPLYLAMTNKTHRIPFKTLKLLLEMCAEPLHWGQTWGLVLDSANEDSTELLEYMVDNYKQNHLTIHTMFLEGLLNGGHPIGVSRTQILTKVFPRLRSLTLGKCQLSPTLPNSILVGLPEWDRDGFVCFLGALETNTSLSKIDFLKLPHLAGEKDPQEHMIMTHAFRSMLENNNTLVSLNLHIGPEDDGGDWASWVQSIETGLESNQTLQFVKLHDVWPGRREVAFCSVLQEYPERKRILSFENCDDEILKKYLPRIPQLFQSLDTLELNTWPRVVPGTPYPPEGLPSHAVITSMIAGLLNVSGKSMALKSLILGDCHVDPLALFDALKANTTLSSLDCDSERIVQVTRPEAYTACLALLQQHNRTLTRCDPWGKSNAKIQHYLDLNARGRAHATTASGDDLVVLLWTVEFQHRKFSFPDPFVRSMMYGLLRESPGSWCNAGRREPTLAAFVHRDIQSLPEAARSYICPSVEDRPRWLSLPWRR